MKEIKKINSLPKYNSIKLIIEVLFCVCVFILIFNIDKYICLPWDTQCTTSNVVSTCSADKASVIVDDSAHRVLFIDKSDKVFNLLQTNKYEKSPKFYRECVCDNEFFYIHQYSYFPSTSYIETEKVVKVSLDGSIRNELITYEYNLEDNRTHKPKIKNISINDNNICLTFYDAIKNKVYYDEFSKDCCEQQQCIDNLDQYELYCINSGKIFLSCLYDKTSNQLLLEDVNKNFFLHDLNNGQALPIDKQDIKNFSLTLSSENKPNCNSSMTYNNFDEFESLHFSLSLTEIVRIILFWFCLIYVIAAIFIFLILLVYKTIKSKFSVTYRVAFIAITTFFIVCLVIVFYTINLSNKTIDDNEKLLYITTEVQSDDYMGIYKAAIKEYNENNYLSDQTYSNLAKLSENLSIYCAKSEVYNISTLNVVKQDGVVELFSSDYPSFSGQTITTVSKDSDFYSIEDDSLYFEGVIWHNSDKDGDFINYSSAIFDDSGNVLGYITCKNEYFVNYFANLYPLLEIAFMFILLIIAVFLIAIELKESILLLFIKYKLIKNNHKNQGEILLARPLSFLVLLSGFIETTLETIVVKSMLQNTPEQGNMFLIALPSVVASLGFFVSTILYFNITKKHGVKKLLVLSCAMSAIFYCLGGISVLYANYIMLMICVFFSNVFKEFVLLYANTLPLHCKDDNYRFRINNQLVSCSISAAVVAGLIAGYSVEIFGNCSIYMLAAIPMLIAFFVVIIWLPKNTIVYNAIFSDSKIKDSVLGRTYKFMFNSQTLLYVIFGLIFVAICSGFQTLIFPLIADDYGLSAHMVSNILVLSNVIAYYSTFIIRNSKFKRSSHVLIAKFQLFMGLLFAMVALNYNFALILFVLVFSNIIVSRLSALGISYLQNIALDLKVDINAAVIVMMRYNTSSTSLGNAILGALLNSLGIVLTCAAIWIYSIIGSLVLILFGHKRDNVSNSHTSVIS